MSVETTSLPVANGVVPAYLCMNQTCPRTGTHYPVIMFGAAERIPGEKLPYRLEIPKAVCPECQKGFQPGVFVTPDSRVKIEAMLKENERPMPDYSRLFVVWKGINDPDWQEVKAAGQARFWF